MNLHWIDWTIVGCMILFLIIIGTVTKKITRSVSDFLAANRCAGRYLLSVSQGIAGMGAISIVAVYEKFYQAGFAAHWWAMMLMPVSLIITLLGWVMYRYRETRALTMAQFFEMRYSRKFRIFSGIMAWISGILNYGIFPAVTGRFIIVFMGLPNTIQLWEGYEIRTLGPVMFIMLAVALYLTFCGGQIAVMITDFFQGQLVNITFAVIAVLLLYKFGWNGIVDTLVKEAQPGASMLNPFDQQADKIKDFNIFFFLILLFMRVYGHGSWQGSQGYRSAAKSAHEAKMAGILGEWRGGVTLLSSMLVPICAWVLMHNAFYANEASAVIDTLKQLPSGQIQKQMLVPMALPHMLPVGVTGMFAVVILAAAVSTDDTYLHSWGSIFVQDVIMPFRKKPFSTKNHMSLLRWAIIGVAAFAWTFSMLFPLQDYILMYFQLTGAIYIGGAGSVIIGGLYWKRGTTEGAWGGMITGSVIAVAGIVIRNCWGMLGLTVFAEKCPLNGVQMAFAAAIMAIIVYVVISLITCKKSFDLDAMLHRKGKNLDMGTHNSNRRKDWLGKIGITEEFTRFDIGIYLFKICWSGLWILAFVVGTTWALMGKSGIVPKTTDGGWAKWWYFQIIVCLIVGIGSAIWFIWGGFRDLIELFQILNNTERDLSDAGWVEENAPEKLEEIIENEMQLPDDPIIITERNSTSIRGNKD